MHFGRNHGCVGPYLAALHTSTRVQNSVEVVDLARGMSSNSRGKFKPELSRWYHSSRVAIISRARFTCSMNILGGIFYGVRTHCGVRMAYHTWYLEAGITYVSILSTFTF